MNEVFSKVRKSVTLDLESGGKVSLTEGVDNKVRLSVTDNDDDSCELSVVITKKEFYTLYWDGTINWPREPEEEPRRGVNTLELPVKVKEDSTYHPELGPKSISDSPEGDPL